MLARENPFTSARLEALPFIFPHSETWELLLRRLENVAWRGAITGPHGTGKTTLLMHLAERLATRGFVPRHFTLRSESSSAEKRRVLGEIPALRAPAFLLLDGAEQLGLLQWLTFRRATRACAGVVITLHRGRRLPAILKTESSAALLAELVRQLTGKNLPPREAAALVQRHRGNLRDCLLELYRLCAH